MATAPMIPITPVRSLTGIPYPRVAVPETASQTYLRGALVRSTAGLLVECGADPSHILGVAANPGHNSAAGLDKTVVYLAHPDTLFKGNLDLSAAVGTGVTAVTDRFTSYGVAKRAVAPLNWYVDKTETTNDRVVVWEFHDEDAIGDVMGRVYFQFVSLFCQGYGLAS